MKKLAVAVVGASGFTGKECLRLLAQHPSVDRVLAMSGRERAEGKPVSYAGALQEPPLAPFDAALLRGLDAVFLCTPHEASAELAADLCEEVRTVIDLSAAYRLADPGLYPAHYAFEHPHPDLLPRAVYGLTEWARPALRGAALIANPGCYVTSVLLPLKALVAKGCLDPTADVIADCKSGVSGAGKTLGPSTHFAAVHDDFRAYAVGQHRHEPEIRAHAPGARVYFTPHLLPVFRGILATLHVRPARGLGAGDLRAALRAHYEGEPFVAVHDEADGLPCLSQVQGSNRCHIGVAAHDDRAVVVSCLDNLIKGASGQAVQNMNVALGLPETHGLSAAPLAQAGWR
jgi:N-acetyl-gamma-glutamyl-phosphate reductase